MSRPLPIELLTIISGFCRYPAHQGFQRRREPALANRMLVPTSREEVHVRTLRNPIAAYGVALVTVAAAVGLRQLLDPVMGDTLPLLTLFGAIAVAVWLGGFGPA